MSFINALWKCFPRVNYSDGWDDKIIVTVTGIGNHKIVFQYYRFPNKNIFLLVSSLGSFQYKIRTYSKIAKIVSATPSCYEVAKFGNK